MSDWIPTARVRVLPPPPLFPCEAVMGFWKDIPAIHSGSDIQLILYPWEGFSFEKIGDVT